MQKIRTGALDLGLDVQWRFAFRDPGERCQPVPDGIFLDVGGELSSGVLDQHHDAMLGGSTVDLVIRFPANVYDHLMLDWLHRARNGEELSGRVWSPVLITHISPDFDGIVAMHLVRKLVEDGDFPPYARALAQYSSMVDQGRYRVDFDRPESGTTAIHLAFLALSNTLPPPGEVCGDSWRVQQGEALLSAALGAITEERAAQNLRPIARAQDLLPGQPGVDRWRTIPSFHGYRDLLDSDMEFFQQDKADATTGEVELPVLNGRGSVKVPFLALTQPSKSKLNKYWVRASGFPFFICPYADFGGETADAVNGEPRYPRVILSLDPAWRDNQGAQPSLHGLGFAIEAEECRHRDADGGDLRLKIPRFEDGSCNNDDPWYDGRGHGHTIVDSPRSGTVLPLSRIVEIATSPFWMIPLVDSEVMFFRTLSTEALASVDEIHAVEPVPGMSYTLNSYIADSRQFPWQGSPDHFTAPPGFEQVSRPSEGIRKFPSDGVNPVALYTFHSGEEATFDTLLHWIRESCNASESRIYICCRLRFGRHFLPAAHTDSMLSELKGSGNDGFVQIDLGDEVLLFNGSSLVLHQPDFISSVSTPSYAKSRLRTYQELVLYAVYLNETLRLFSDRIGRAVDEKGNLHGVKKIREDFLRFQSRYFQHDVATDPHMRRVFHRTAEELLIVENYQEVQSELDRLDNVSERKSASTMEVLLFVLGLGAVVEAVAAIPTAKDKWLIAWVPHSLGIGDYLKQYPKLLLGGGVVLLACTLFRYSRRRSGERDRT